MLFNSIEFFIFFPVVTILYFLLPYKYRTLMLLAASCYFYMSFIPVYILILALTISIDYYAGIQIYKSEGPRKKLFLTISILSTCAILFVFKYFNFFNSNFEALAHFLHWNYPVGVLKLILPIGLSFHTFQSLSYVIEVYNGNQKPEHDFITYSLYVMFYPQLVAGPIERPQNLLHQFHEKHDFNYDRVKRGLMLMGWGLFKKMVLADRLSIYVNMIYNDPGHYHGLPVIVATVFFAFQIYFDFSGYSDVAIGAARVMGFNLMQNFNRPYVSKSIGEFWSRWHISLSTWFKDYLYIPLGGNRVKLSRLAFNIMVVFIVSGLWHGAGWTFIIWGFLHGAARTLEILTQKTRTKLSNISGKRLFNALSYMATFVYVCFAWIFFRARSLEDALILIRSMFRHSSASSIFNKMFTPFIFLEFAVLLALTFYLEYKARAFQSLDMSIAGNPKVIRWSFYTFIVAGILILGNFGKIDFIYFQF